MEDLPHGVVGLVDHGTFILREIVVHAEKVQRWRRIFFSQNCLLGALSPFPPSIAPINDSSINASELKLIHVHNCSTWDDTITFDLTCLASANFTNTSTDANFTLYQCLVDCFFNWSVASIRSTPTINISRHQSGSTVELRLTSDLFGFNPLVFCPRITNPYQITTSSPEAITSHSSVFSESSSISSSDSTRTTTTASPPLPFIPCANGTIGVFCNETMDPCIFLQPCLNHGTCSTTSPSSYFCSCPRSKFIGINCEIDIRPCQPWPCLNGGHCNETTATSFVCQCRPGYEGKNCQHLTNYCQNITCQNKGQCRPRPRNFTCECTGKEFSGRYCETTSSALVIKQAVTRSFAYIAILAISCLFGFIIVMDVLKYVFNIDPVEAERIELEEKKRLARAKRTKPIIVQRFIYVDHPSRLRTIPEE